MLDVSYSPLGRLRWRWLGVALVWLAAWLGLYSWLRWQWLDAGCWLWASAPVLAYGLWVLWRDLPLNRREGETAVLPTLGLGNVLTLWRGLAVALVAGFLFSPWPQGWLGWLPMLLYTSADVVDYLDGYAARVTNHATLLGARLDMEFDGLGMLVVSLLAVWYGQLPGWYLSLGLARYLFVFGLWWRERRGLPVHAMPSSTHRRIFAGFQMGFMSAVLWPIVPPLGATIAGTIFAAATGAGFLRDWLMAIGWLRPESARYRRWQQWVYRAAREWLPPLLRVGLAGMAVSLLTAYPDLFPPAAWVTLFAGWHLPWPTALAVAALLLFVAGVLMAGLGVLGRVWALLLVFPLGFDMITQGATWVNGAALACVISLMLLGTGPLSLWRPEEKYMVRRAGEKDEEGGEKREQGRRMRR